MVEHYLLDTDIIVEYLRGRDQAADFIESLEGDLFLSSITVAKLSSGIRDDEQQSLTQFLLAFEVIAVSESIARRGGHFRRDYRQSHGTGFFDALIAATAEEAHAILVTFNYRHFPMLDEIQVPSSRK